MSAAPQASVQSGMYTLPLASQVTAAHMAAGTTKLTEFVGFDLSESFTQILREKPATESWGKPNTQNPERSWLMEPIYGQAENTGSNWREALAVAFDLGMPSIFNIEWLVDKAERGDWGRQWW